MTAAESGVRPDRRGGGARARILESARELFRTRGINATGIDSILTHGGAARGSLYYNFTGKDELVVAYLDDELRRWSEAVTAIDETGAPASRRVSVMFDALVRTLDEGSFVGCPFTNAVVEQPDNAEVRAIARRYRDALHEHVAGLTGLAADDERVRRIVVLYEGAIMAAKTSGGPDGVHVARALAVDVLERPSPRTRGSH